MEPIVVSTSVWHELRLYAPFGFLALTVILAAVLIARDRRRADRNYASLAAAVEAEAARWHPVFWSGCHEYQQHEDGRRRAVRVMSGVDSLRLDWLGIGEDVQT